MDSVSIDLVAFRLGAGCKDLNHAPSDALPGSSQGAGSEVEQSGHKLVPMWLLMPWAEAWHAMPQY